MKRPHVGNIDALFALLTLCGVVGMLILGVSGLGHAQASTDFGNYNSTRITSSIASSSASTRIQNQGTLGSVVILATSTSALSFYDGTGSATSTSELLFTVPTTTPPGTYTFDIQIDYGLIVDVPSTYNGQAVVTHRR